MAGGVDSLNVAAAGAWPCGPCARRSGDAYSVELLYWSMRP